MHLLRMECRLRNAAKDQMGSQPIVIICTHHCSLIVLSCTYFKVAEKKISSLRLTVIYFFFALFF